MAETTWVADAITTLLTTELDALANGSGAVDSSEYDNSTSLNLYATFELNVDFVSAPTAGSAVNLYLIPAPDGTNYDDYTTGASPYAPASSYAGAFPMNAVTAAQKIPLGVGGTGPIPLPPHKFKAYVINNSGQAFPANGSTLKMVPYRYETV